MPLSSSLNRYLTQHHVAFDTVSHYYSQSALQSAVASHIPADEVAKAVILKDPVDNFLMAVIPSSRRLHLHVLEDILDTSLKLADRRELNVHFKDCEEGAIPPMGPAFNMGMIWDDSFLSSADVYLEAGDHLTLVHVSGGDFKKLVGESSHDQISRPPRSPLG